MRQTCGADNGVPVERGVVVVDDGDASEAEAAMEDSEMVSIGEATQGMESTPLCRLSITRRPQHHNLPRPPQTPIPRPPPDPHPPRQILPNQSQTPQKPHPHTPSPSSSSTPLSPQSYGAYSISLPFGTPPNPSPSSSTPAATSSGSPAPTATSAATAPKPPPPPPFIPKLSHSSKLVGCKNPKCLWIHPDPNRLNNCTSTHQLCPPYLVLYGSASTGGVLLSDTLNLSPPSKSYPDFAVGCSLFSSGSPAGIAGFGRGPASLPSQLRLAKFSYCQVSHRFDGASAKSSSLNLAFSGGAAKAPGTAYTRFLSNPTAGKRAFGVYYYLGLRRISIGGVEVKIAAKYLSPQADGNGGVIVDSGSTFTFMEAAVFEPVAREIVKQVENRYRRLRGVEERVGLAPCFNVSGEEVAFPKLVLHFKGGADMELPLPNYVAFVGRGSDAVCMTVLTDGGDGGEGVSGPAVILGNHLMQNFYVEYDLRNNRFGFRRQLCL
ncbi:hypothetical protein Syun_002473 [Stephania yunnanensis]|uniref:Peptidase A1 domain-containing protein n=1 Tax=Stephania yunnanensis TaxID=152371 RepID=A0AAP0Q823_9MAGN